MAAAAPARQVPSSLAAVLSTVALGLLATGYGAQTQSAADDLDWQRQSTESAGVDRDEVADPAARRALDQLRIELRGALHAVDALRTEVVDLRSAVAALQGESAPDSASKLHRRAQAPGGDAAGDAEPVMQYRRHWAYNQTWYPPPSDQCYPDDAFRGDDCPDGCVCSAPQWPACDVWPPPDCSHRRAMQSSPPQMCSTQGELAARVNKINHECCDEIGEDCSSGAPESCNIGCSVVVLDFWRDCQSTFKTSSTDKVSYRLRLCFVVQTD